MPVITDSSAQSHAELKALLVAMLADFGGLNGSEVYDAGSIADGDEEVGEITVTGASLGDFVLASLSIDVADLTITGAVTATNTVTYQLLNNTGGAIDLASATVYVRVIPRTPTVTLA
ncbi:hypothetical protein GW916_01915 [bacterium]|nr:hypothetical protein [bacterium]